MPDNTEKSIPGSENTTYLPNFCDGEAFLRLLLVVELIAIVFALVSLLNKTVQEEGIKIAGQPV